MKRYLYAALLAVMLSLNACTVGEALLGAGAAGLGGYIIGREASDDHSHHHYRHRHRHGY